VLKIVYSVRNLFTAQGSCFVENFEVSTGKLRRTEASTPLILKMVVQRASETSVLIKQINMTANSHDLNSHQQRCKPQISQVYSITDYQIICTTWRWQLPENFDMYILVLSTKGSSQCLSDGIRRRRQHWGSKGNFVVEYKINLNHQYKDRSLSSFKSQHLTSTDRRPDVTSHCSTNMPHSFDNFVSCSWFQNYTSTSTYHLPVTWQTTIKFMRYSTAPFFRLSLFIEQT